MSDQYTPLKTAIIWAGAVLLAIVVVTAILIGVRVDSQKSVDQYTACFKSGQSAAECAVALQ